MAKPQQARTKTNQPGDSAQVRLQAVPGYIADPEASGTDRLIYERVRLGIMSALSVNRSLSFAELKALLNTSDGNLSTHARKLEDAGYVTCRKHFAGRVPKTEFRLSARGKKVFERYLDHMEALIRATRRS